MGLLYAHVFTGSARALTGQDGIHDQRRQRPRSDPRQRDMGLCLLQHRCYSLGQLHLHFPVGGQLAILHAEGEA